MSASVCGRVTCGLALTSLAVVVGADAPAVVKVDSSAGAAIRAIPAGIVAPGHHTQEMVEAMGLLSDRGLVPPAFDPAAAPESALESGAWVNFEAPLTRGLALDATGRTLYAAHPPNNTVAVIDAAASPPRVVDHIWVGLDPVSLALEPDANRLWVTCYTSDAVVVVDLNTHTVEEVIEVGDRPVNILFDEHGTTAFIICEGSPTVLDVSPGAPAGINQEGTLVAVEADDSPAIIASRWLDMHTPRAAVYDRLSKRVIVAALHSGENTTVVGRPIAHLTDPNPPGGAVNTQVAPSLVVPLLMPSVSAAWSSPLLTPWPDATNLPLPGGQLPELIQRIVADAGHAPDPVNFPWQQIVRTLDGATLDGLPDPAMVAEYKSKFEAAFGNTLTLTNAFDVLLQTMRDAKDTVDHDLAVVDVSSVSAGAGAMPVMFRHGGIGGTITGLDLDPVSSRLAVTTMVPRNTTRLDTKLRGKFMEHRVVMVGGWNSASPIVDSKDLHAAVANFDDASAPNPAAQGASLANPSAVVFRADGQRVYVAALGSGRVGTLAPDGSVIAVRDVCDAFSSPRSMVLDETDQRLYVLDRSNFSVARLDTGDDALPLIDEVCLANPEPLKTKQGRKFLFSTRHSNNFSSSCAMCHVDAHLDHRAWDLGSPGASDVLHAPHQAGTPACFPPDPAAYNHPIKGPMVTQSLRGLRNHSPLHWRGDKKQFTDFNEAFTGLLGAQNQLSDADMLLFDTYVRGIAYEPTFYRHRDNTFKNPGALGGREDFIAACNGCHNLAHDGALADPCADSDDLAFNYFGGAFFAQVELVPEMRFMPDKFVADRYNGFGLLHDGREERENHPHPIAAFLADFFPGITDAAGMIAFLDAFQTNVMPCVGEEFLWTNADVPGGAARLSRMIQQHTLVPSRCDVVVYAQRGTTRRSWYLSRTTPGIVFTSDSNTLNSLAQMQQLVSGGATLLVAAVPPGSGQRIGVNWDRDCAFNALDATPLVFEGDINDDLKVNTLDLTELLGSFGQSVQCYTRGDFDGSGSVNTIDLTAMLGAFGANCQ